MTEIIIALIFNLSLIFILYNERTKKILKERNDRIIDLKKWRGLIDDKLLKDLRWKILSKKEFDSAYITIENEIKSKLKK